MLISEKQRQANIASAQKSTGPKTEEGKAVTRMNAFRHGLRSRYLLIYGECVEEFEGVWAGLNEEFQPMTPSERYLVEQMAHAQWLLIRVTAHEARISSNGKFDLKEEMALLNLLATRRTKLERSFTHAIRELKALRGEPVGKQSKAVKSAQPVRTEPLADEPITPPVLHFPEPEPEYTEDDVAELVALKARLDAARAAAAASSAEAA